MWHFPSKWQKDAYQKVITNHGTYAYATKMQRKSVGFAWIGKRIAQWPNPGRDAEEGGRRKVARARTGRDGLGRAGTGEAARREPVDPAGDWVIDPDASRALILRRLEDMRRPAPGAVGSGGPDAVR
jgi:hypothetical protein